MRKMRFIENCRCYHLISLLYPPAVRLLAKRGALRGAHQAFFLDDNEKTRAVELLRRVEEFSTHFNRYYFPVAGEGRHCSNRSRSSAVAPAEVLPDMSYYISDTMSTSPSYVSLRGRPRPRAPVEPARGRRHGRPAPHRHRLPWRRRGAV